MLLEYSMSVRVCVCVVVNTQKLVCNEFSQEDKIVMNNKFKT